MLFRVVILLLLSSDLQAQVFNAAPYLAMGNTGLACETIYSVTNNPAGLSALKNTQVALAHQTHFLTTDIHSQALYVAQPLVEMGVIGLAINNYGIPHVSTALTARGAYARQFGPYLSSSLSANYHRYYVRNYESDQVFSFDLGFQAALGQRMRVGAYWKNISRALYNDDILQYIPAEIGVGSRYQLSDELSMNSDLYYNWLSGWSLRTGLSYQVAQKIIFRAGAASHPMQYFSGIGLFVKKMQIDLAASFHPRLGTSPQIALAYGF